ncbi:type IX secretion system membrane protein, PorP/SprF family [Flavobacterium resistens]|uniref:Type IX secretion system membrane protein PorP/SprF n=1 Tax=Flavobacterium resistens TaxID=443612 RepID=A0A521EZD3_9FLAO|nr:type IX secretion system membrane protein PorP/SprF [Flavobacterium resistens]MRX69319.1 type IX secretion system membrane protein PorP/SprF [Flavobacterium resistens]SMO89223.1 type IX secretion system membrane protein, PorP/SprF family [Flavobacterium resistens]
MKLKNKIQKYILLFLVAGCAMTANAQQESQFTQYMYNTVSINPAYAGSRDVLSINGLYRTQWVGLEGAPKTATFSLNTPVNDRVGLGVSVLSDKIGPSSETGVSADFSYNIVLNDTYRLFFGLKGTANFLNIDYSKLEIYNPEDPNMQQNLDKKFSPNVGAGVYLQSDKAYVGLSVPSILETTQYNHGAVSHVKEKMHAYLIGGYVFDLSTEVKFKPAVLLKATVGAPLQADVSANFLFSDKLTLGVAYRWDAAFSALAGFQITPGLMAGYAYDFDTTNLGNYNSGSHEIFLRFEVFKNNQRIFNPRFF